MPTKKDMSDLSRLLDDVYRSAPRAPAPAWSPGTAALDEVFSNWMPSPAPVVETDPEVLDEVEVLPEPSLPAPTPGADRRGTTPGRVWSISDDDILPPKRARRLRLRRR